MRNVSFSVRLDEMQEALEDVRHMTAFPATGCHGLGQGGLFSYSR